MNVLLEEDCFNKHVFGCICICETLLDCISKGSDIRMHLYFWNLTVFVKEGEVVEDVCAEHDVLSGVDPQHHRHLISN